MLELLGFCGFARTGKNTAATELAKILEREEGRESQQIGFADELKQHLLPLVMYCKRMGIVTSTPQFKEKFRPMWVEWSRVLKDVTGNEMIWVELAQRKIKDICIRNANLCMITDVRYDYEIEFINDHGGKVIYIERPEYTARNYEEELSFKKINKTFIYDIKRNTVINDSTKEELGRRCYELLKTNNLL